MNLASISIRRPVFTVMMAFAIFILGILGYSRLGTDLFPDVSFPVVVVNVVYPGASPGEVEELISKPLEDALVSINGIDRLNSQSRESLSTVVLQFELDVDVVDAATQVREKVAAMRRTLPQDVQEPSITRFDVAALPVMTYTVSGPRDTNALREFAEDVIKPSLEQVQGVASIEVNGGAAREISIEIDRARLDALSLAPALVVQSLKAANINVPAGRYEEGKQELAVRTIGEFSDVEEIRNMIIAVDRNGSAVRLRDVALVQDGFAEQRRIVRVNGQDAVTFDVFKQSGTNTVAISDAVVERIAEIAPNFPEGINASPLIEQSKFIKENAEEVEIAIVYGGAMAILIILLFMLDLRSTLISAVALPISVVGTFAIMYALGYTLNMMTLLGLSLAIGLLIDDAVVVRENIFKHLERGKTPWQAAIDGTSEISLSVFATTMTIVAVFMPVSFVGGIVGQFFQQFGITVSAAVLLSLVVAFTIDPMLSSRFSSNLIHIHEDKWAWFKHPFRVFFDGMDNTYRAILYWSLKHKLVVGFMAFASLGAMGVTMGFMGSDFVAPEDRGQFIVDVELPAGTSLAETDRLSRELELEVLKNSEVHTVFANIGLDSSPNKLRWRILTSSKSERPEIPLTQIKDYVRNVAQKMPGASVNANDPPLIEGGGAESPIMILVRGASYDDISHVTGQIDQILRETAGVADVQVHWNPGKPELAARLDRQRIADAGLSVAQVALALRGAIEGEEAGKLRLAGDEIPLKVRFAAEDRDDSSSIGNITLLSQRGIVRLTDVATLTRDSSPQIIEREDRNRQIKVTAAPNGRSLGEIVQEIQPRIQELKLPAGVRIVYDGQIKMMSETNGNMAIALLLGVLFIYIVLASQFESFIHPFTIMLTLPLALVGAILGLFFAGKSMAMGAMIGIILLMGLVTKNAILLVDRAIVRVREQGETPWQAILEAGPERLRPILMTSAAMVLGMIPTAISNGDGSEFRAPMAIAIIGGVISSTLLSLLVVPVFYLAIENLKQKLGVGNKNKDVPIVPISTMPPL